ncbi:MAG TPA: asparagine synthase (glutamine-hydrolyzing), partial [Gemmatimonadaceae bacterium]|nr:asparagine synthase (glutamine-hydrolyzing) [Gemmatimonadaceae bacterium]
MCGIAGIARADARGVGRDVLRRMAAQIRHRGPDDEGILPGPRVGFAHTRLSIIDLAHGAQPLGNEDDTIVIVYNGEVYNYLELRARLLASGHRFRTATDTEVLVHAYEEWGTGMLAHLNGQFAFAIHDQRDDSVFVARDRFGICPLFYAQPGHDFVFASEAKAIFASGEVRAAPDLRGLDEVFTLWSARAPRTPFSGVSALEPGTYAVWRDGTLRVARYYEPRFDEAETEPADALLALDEVLRRAVTLRMRADVPVGGYLSGGLDSSITCSLAAAGSPHELRTFSVTFEDPSLDESAYQMKVAAAVRSRHAIVRIGAREIAEVFPTVVRHAETPLVRTG